MSYAVVVKSDLRPQQWLQQPWPQQPRLQQPRPQQPQLQLLAPWLQPWLPQQPWLQLLALWLQLHSQFIQSCQRLAPQPRPAMLHVQGLQPQSWQIQLPAP